MLINRLMTAWRKSSGTRLSFKLTSIKKNNNKIISMLRITQQVEEGVRIQIHLWPQSIVFHLLWNKDPKGIKFAYKKKKELEEITRKQEYKSMPKRIVTDGRNCQPWETTTRKKVKRIKCEPHTVVLQNPPRKQRGPAWPLYMLGKSWGFAMVIV